MNRRRVQTISERLENIRVLLADDHTMFRQGLREMLSTDESIEVLARPRTAPRP
jgi:PleD family two-component response regulator